MKKKLLILFTTLMMLTISYTGCFEQPKPKLEISFDTQETDSTIQLIVTSLETNKKYNWRDINITLTSQYVDPYYLVKEGEMKVGDIVEIPQFVFENLSKIFVRMRLNSSYVLLWGETVYAPSPTPVISFKFEQNKLIIDSIDKIDYEWDFDISLTNFSYIITDELVYPNKLVKIGDIIDLNKYELYEEVDFIMTYNPTNEIVANLSLNLTELDPEIYLTVHEIEIDNMVTSTHFYIYSGKTTFGTKDINWQITPDLPSWINVEPMSGVFKYGRQRVNVTFSTSGMAGGEYSHIINITSNYGDEELKIILTN